MPLITGTLGTDPGTGISGYATTLAGTSLGPLGMIERIAIEGAESDEIEVSTMNSPGRWKQFIAGMRDANRITLDILYYKSQVNPLFTNQGVNDTFTIHLPDGSTFATAGFIKKIGWGIPMNDKISQQVIIRLSGPPTFLAGS